MAVAKLIQSVVIIFLASPVVAQSKTQRSFSPKDFRILSLNLHAYHPMAEPQRISQDPAGKTEEAHSDIYFFTPQELDRGSRLRLDVLAKAVQDLEPDLILFQEVT
ncbi:MAG: hypothetical protein K2X47_17080, partial [Bdellovibrionales bacterium]|nr:hypothetical protein [Bdellovibrionales bacterium]